MGGLGLPGLVLMENAGAGATRVLLQHFAGQLSRVLCVGGVGQNGGDAWVVARHLLAHGITPECAIVGDPVRVRGDAAVNLAVLRALGLAVHVVENAMDLSVLAETASLLVDGVFGTGLDRPITGLYAEALLAMSAAARPTLALDLPSGIDADTGQVLGVALRAHVTATFAAQKRGLSQFPGRAHAGQVCVVDLGVPLSSQGTAALIEAEDVARLMPRREAAGHKGSHGHVLLLAGSAGKTGAALLAALGALRGGAGLVTLATDAETQRALDAKTVEAMTLVLPQGGELTAALAAAEGKAACLLGPGFGLSADRRGLSCRLALELPLPMVVDADALTALAEAPERLRTAAGPRLLTPHPGEAARLLGVTTGAIAGNRFQAALELAGRTGQTVVLKGAGTLIASPEGRLAVCERGTPALGTGGTGDVLAGLCTALLASLPPFEAAICAVELHARAGELAATGDRGLLASEVAHALPSALAACRTAGA
jgi:NAD(P)H-hydrate epimerase